ncbi:MAG: Fic family protein [Rhodocyclaceae bacterium]
MNEYLRQLEALFHHPALQVSPDQRPAIVGNILHHLMRPYFLKRTPTMQEKFGEQQYQVFTRGLADYCLREYVDSPEPRLTIECIKGLHRQFYGNAASIPVKAVDGTMTSMVPGEFKTTRVFIRRHSVPGEWFDTTAPEDVARDMALLLETLHDEEIPLVQRYIRFVADFGRIHPFPDSNGKVYMLLGDLFLLKHGIHPPYYAKYKLENEALVYGLYDRYFLDPQRDVSIFYPVVAKAYEGHGVDHCLSKSDAIAPV